MTKVHLMEKEAKSLDKNKLTEFRDWFLEFASEAWDARIEQDAHSGKLDRLAKEALEQHERGGESQSLVKHYASRRFWECYESLCNS